MLAISRPAWLPGSMPTRKQAVCEWPTYPQACLLDLGCLQAGSLGAEQLHLLCQLSSLGLLTLPAHMDSLTYSLLMHYSLCIDSPGDGAWNSTCMTSADDDAGQTLPVSCTPTGQPLLHELTQFSPWRLLPNYS